MLEWLPAWLGSAYSLLYTSSGGGTLTFADVVKTLGKSEPYCKVVLSRLARAGYLQVEREGRLRRYVLKEPLEVILQVGGFSHSIEQIHQPLYKPLLTKVLLALLRTLGTSLISVVLYGSVARGTSGPESDLDILIILKDDGSSFGDRLHRLRNVDAEIDGERLRLYQQHGYSSSIQFYPLTQSEVSQDRPLFLDMIFDSVILYDRDNFMLKRLDRLRSDLERTGVRKVELPNGRWFWMLKPAIAGRISH